MRYAILLLSSLLLFPSVSFAAISFTNGYWSTTFNCNDWSQPNALSCDGVEMDNDSDYAGSQGSLINSSGNYSSGGGGKGWRTYYTGSSLNDMSTATKIVFPSQVTQFWVRFYYRIPTGQYTGSLNAHKLIYTSGPGSLRVDWPRGAYIGLEGGAIDYTYGQYRTGYDNVSLGNWNSLYGGPPSSTTADGSWHCFEFYFNVGTTSSNGIFRFWLDGVNVINDTAANLGGGSGGYFTGFLLPHNHNYFSLSGNNPHDLDDIAVATSSYTGFTTNTEGFTTGLNMIGPLSGGGGDTTAPSTTISTSDPSSISIDSLTVTGSASDAVGVSGCKWRIGSAPNAGAGTSCTGTTSFSCSTSGYSSGSNTLYVGCYDAAGNYGSDSMTVNYTPQSEIGSFRKTGGAKFGAGGGRFHK